MVEQKSEEEWFQYYRDGKGYNRAQASNMAHRRYMTQVIADLKTNHPEKYALLQQKVKDLEQKEIEERQDREAFERQRAEVRRAGRYQLEHSLMCTGVPLPEFNLSPLEVEELVACGEQGTDRCLVSFRQWNVSTDGLLHGVGVGSGYAWKEINFADQNPEDCRDHGLYSVRLDPHGLLTNAGNYVGDYCGLLELRGTIVEHDDGVLRAEYARILCIWITLCSMDVFLTVPQLHAKYPSTPLFVCTRRQVADALFKVTAILEFGG